MLHLCEGFASLEPGDTGTAFMTDEMDALVARTARGAVEFPVPPKKEKWGTMAKFADPDGNIFWVFKMPTAMVRATVSSRAPSPKRTPAKSRVGRGLARRRTRIGREHHQPGAVPPGARDPRSR